MQTLTIEQLNDIIAASTITSTASHAGMLIHSIEHPTIGKAAAIQGDDGGLLISSQ
jgi:hypothetical protein